MKEEFYVKDGNEISIQYAEDNTLATAVSLLKERMSLLKSGWELKK